MVELSGAVFSPGKITRSKRRWKICPAYLGRIAKNTMSSAATTTIPTIPRISGRLDFLAGAGAGAIFGMAGWAIAGGAKAWGEGAATGAGVAEVCPKVS